VATSQQHIRLYGFLRKELLSRYFALGRERRNDFFQESTELAETPSAEELLDRTPSERAQVLWRKWATRDNPWLFGCKLTIALATEARLGLPGADEPLDRTIRSCERLFRFPGVFRGLPVRWDPVTSDHWYTTPEGRRLPQEFLVTPDGRDYVFSHVPSDARHFPYLVPETGRRLIGRRLFERFTKARDDQDSGYVKRYRSWETSQDELVGVMATYVAAAEGARDQALRALARSRLLRVAEYLAAHAYLVVLPGGGLASRGCGDALPALEWPFTRAVARVTGRSLPFATVSFQEGLTRAGLWELFRGPTDRAMAASWALGLTVGSPFLLVLYKILALWSAASWTPKFLTPGNVGFVAGVHEARDGFDVSNNDAAGGMAMAALLHSWGVQARFLNYVEFVAEFTREHGPFSTGFVPFLGFISAGDQDRTTADAYQYWLSTRRARGIDAPTGDYSATCFATAVGLLLGEGRNPAEERELVRLLNARHDSMAAAGEAAVRTPGEARAAADYLAALALAWRYRRERQAAGEGVDTREFPGLPPSNVAWPEPAVPRVVVETLPEWVPVQAIQGQTPPTYNSRGEAPLFTAGSPRRPAVFRPGLSFEPGEPLYDEMFRVRPGTELFTGIVLQWGDEWEATAEGELTVGGDRIGPGGREETVWDARFPLHGGRDTRAGEHCVLARLNNYVLIGAVRPRERWLYPEETFLYLRLNQWARAGRGGFDVRVRVRGPRRPLSRLLEVSCIRRPSKEDADKRLKAVGGVHRDGSRWELTLDEALEAMAQGTIFFIRAPEAGAAELAAAGRPPRRYLRSRPDPSRWNNLSGLPGCPAA
jgi:hypothetical protein